MAEQGNQDEPRSSAYLLGSLKSEMGSLKTGLQQAEEILNKLQEEIRSHENSASKEVLALENEIANLKRILTEQTKRVTALFEVTNENTKWLHENGALVDVVEDHEKRVTDLEHNRSFVKGIAWLCGGAIAVFGFGPIFKKFAAWLFGVNE